MKACSPPLPLSFCLFFAVKVNGEAAYFVVVLRKLRTVLVAIRGTETPEDLLTDGLSQECLLSNTDLLGLLT